MHSSLVTRIGIVQQVVRRYPVKGQRRVCHDNGADNIVELGGKQGYTLVDLWNGARPEIEYVCEWLWLLAPTRGPIVTRKSQLLQFLIMIRERGSTLLEAGSGRKTDDAKQSSIMIAEALQALGTKQQPGTGRRPGRRKQGREGDDEKAKAVWDNLREYPTYQLAEAAFPKGWGDWQKAYRLWKGRGRLAKRRKT